MSAVVQQALKLWGLEAATVSLIATRENHVYRVNREGETYALRLHRQGLHSNAALQSELQWLAAIGAGGVGVPSPIAAKDGRFLQTIDGVQVDVLTWLSGRPLGATTQGIDHPDRTSVFRALGQEMARLHTVSDAWTPSADFARWSWDRAGLLGDAPLWDRFWENPSLNVTDRALFANFRFTANRDLERLETTLDYGLIHADLVRENVMVDGDHVRFIDFDDAGFGFRLFDVATALIKNLDEPDYPDLKAALLAGYRAERPLDPSLLDLFMALRAATYVGWIISRLDEEGGHARNTRFIKTARTVLTKYLNRSTQSGG
ncbi:phosphotransferase enzyme family protein [Falsiruegeria mediterranea]|uniref:Homoserine kinase n=1 Tax=Falsiruegeria mediterranea M17 TaxID=1200281 RepID=A0A2R8CEP1_9RHOB|nr:homoserine kinase [Falsiruegeria mediterranea]SPJ30914.1 Homoserine kinase [Falsiruegeria mediterranea M17]